MATPLSASALVRALREEGCEVREYGSWRTHNRNHKGPWGPVNGVMIHHTVTRGTDSSVRLCYHGHSSLPGPLCHGVIDKAGTIWLVGNGRANHAGAGDGDVLRAVIAERDLPPDNEADTDGNRHFYGFEAVNLGDGKDPWPDAQKLAIERASAAICRAHGWNERSVIGHLEWQPGKVDPRGFSMSGMRGRIARRLGSPADSTPDTPAQEDDDMPQLVNIGETDWKILPPGAWDNIEFHKEWDDERDDHYDPSGSQFVRGPARFTGAVHLRFDRLPVGEQVQVRLARVKGGETVHHYPIHEVHGTSGDAFASVPIVGHLDRGSGMRVQVYHWQAEPIRFKAYLEALVWEGN